MLSTEQSERASSPQRARLGVLIHFAVGGTGLGVWASRLPAVKEGLGLDDGDIGLVLFISAIGAMLSLRAAGRVIERYGSRRTTQLAGIAVTAAYLLPAAANNLATLAIVLFFFGVSLSMQDVAMNAQAVAIEKRIARPIMSSFHAAFSVGGIIGAGIGAATAKLELSYRPTFAVVSAFLFLAILMANRDVLEAPETGRRPHHVQRDKSSLPNRKALVALGVIGLASFVAEGAATDWTAIYLSDGIGASEDVAAMGFVVFAGTMTLGRLAGDRLATRFGALPLIRAGTLLAGVALIATLAVGTITAGFIGFAALGFGLSFVVPQVFSAAGALAPARAAAGLSFVSSIAYLGFLTGPAVIGAIARQTSLRVALLVPAVLVLVSSILASRLHTQDSGQAEAGLTEVGADSPEAARLGNL